MPQLMTIGAYAAYSASITFDVPLPLAILAGIGAGADDEPRAGSEPRLLEVGVERLDVGGRELADHHQQPHRVIAQRPTQRGAGSIDDEHVGPAARTDALDDLALLLAGRRRGERDRVVVVPVGVPEAPLDRPRAPALDVVVAAHALERRTGPVFPSPRVIAIVHAQLAGLRGRDDGDSTGADVWAQARRALPRAADHGRRPRPGRTPTPWRRGGSSTRGSTSRAAAS